MDFRSAFKNTIDTLRNFGSGKVENSFSGARDFWQHGSRDRLVDDSSIIEISREDLYKGYPYAVIQKRGNKVATLAKSNLKTWAKKEVIDKFQEAEEQVYHPYLTLIEDSTRFSEKQFWKNISIYLDLAGRYYLGVVRTTIGSSDMVSDVKEFVMLNPYEIRRVVNNDGELAGYIEYKSDGRYREWPTYMIIEMRELNPFDPDNSQWSMAEAAKPAVFTLQEGGNYTRESLHGNIDAPGIITTDVILDDESFANFRARVREHRKGEPIFGNGAGAIKWESMQTDLDKAALTDINNISREELFAVSGTSKTTLGIEQSGTTRDTARVQTENFASETVQPRLEDIIDYLNLDYKKYYPEKYKETGFSIIIESAVGTDFSVENEATTVRSSQADLAFKLIQAKYTPESSYQYAVGDIELSDLQLQDGYDIPQLGEQGGGSDGGNGDLPSEGGDENDDLTGENSVVVNEVAPDEQGWVGAITESIDVNAHLTNDLKSQLFNGDLKFEKTNIPGEENPHFTVVYGLTEEGMDMDLTELCQQYIPESVSVEKISAFDNADEYNVVVAELEKTEELEKMHKAFLGQDHYPQEFSEYRPHITLCYVNKEASVDDFVNVFKDLEGKSVVVKGWEIDNPWHPDKSYNSFNGIEVESNEVECSCTQKKIADFVNELDGLDGDSLQSAYDVLLGDIVDVQKDAISEAISQVSLNSFSVDDISNEKERKNLLERLKDAFRRYWWFVMPLFGSRVMTERNKEFDKNFTFLFDEALKEKIEEEIGEVSESHLRTILNDILDASNKAFTVVVEKAAAGLIIAAYRDDPERFKEYFSKEPSEKKALSVIRNTDILEKNRKIYDRAYKLAEEGYDRRDIIKSIQDEYQYLSDVRANTIAGNETARAFSQSQYEADYQFLSKTGDLTTAYKELFSRSGDPCVYCQKLIDKGAIPFTQNFLDKGESVTVDDNGRVRTFTANYEAISSGVVHPNCHCSYRLILGHKADE